MIVFDYLLSWRGGPSHCIRSGMVGLGGQVEDDGMCVARVGSPASSTISSSTGEETHHARTTQRAARLTPTMPDPGQPSSPGRPPHASHHADECKDPHASNVGHCHSLFRPRRPGPRRKNYGGQA